jgi:benzoylformate decarboxylase
LGVGIPGAIGIKIADPGKTVIGLTGDGGSMYTIQALWTAAHHNIGTKFIICNNHSYRLLKLNISAYWKERDIPRCEYPEMFSITNPDLDFVTISQGLGVPAVKVEKPEDIEPAIKNMLNADGPFLIDLYVETEADHHKVSCKCGQ